MDNNQIRYTKETNSENCRERAILVGLRTEDIDENDFDISMRELVELAKACEMEVLFYITQNLPIPNRATYIGSGKISEIKEEIIQNNADILVINENLSPIQLRNLQRELDIPILDRTLLILEIFSKRAKTREAKIQVEVAQLQYMLPRLVGLHGNLNRQGGASGSMSNRGAGEKKIELDKRRLEHRLAELRNELKEVENQRKTQKKQRNQSAMMRVSLVGYTNAGKSTLMNAMLEQYYHVATQKAENKMVYEEDMLFATLDTTVRKISPTNHIPFLLSDTVGFVSHLPHGLVKAFSSTLEEVKDADLLLHVVDASDVHHDEQTEVTQKVLEELEAGTIPYICIYNKADLCLPEERLPIIQGNRIYMSAKKRIGLDALLDMMEEKFLKAYCMCKMLIPYDKGSLVSYLNQTAQVQSTEYKEEGVQLLLKLKKSDYEKYQVYIVK